VTIQDAEDQIRGQDYETAFVWNSEGLLVLKKDGDEYEVSFTDEEVLSMKSGILTHNHPFAMKFPEADPRSFGHSFSEDDIRLACRAELSEIRAVTRKLRFSMKPSSTGWNLNYWTTVVKPGFEHHYETVWDELSRAFSSGTITSAEADIRVLHETWLQAAIELNMVYLQERS